MLFLAANNRARTGSATPVEPLNRRGCFPRTASVQLVEISVRNDPGAQRYVATAGEREAGFAAYVRARDRIAFMHTEVADDFEGQGVGGQLARHALDEARAEGLEVLPFCPFIRGWIERHPDYVELVPGDERGRFGLV